ncbi:hypothetical protein SH668x_001364 [Planctomicrobium sp. SH668]|uniref:hypothetical protein n=1 Tax=Planctomicrobium sp. SH668 TaxID=3448126 RepID=UPI003F5CBC9B
MSRVSYQFWTQLGLIIVASLCSSSVGAGEVVTVAGTGVQGNSPNGTVGTSAQIGEPYGLTGGPDGALYVCEIGNHLIRRIDLSTGETQVVAGTGKKGYTGDGGPASEATMFEPYEVRFDSKGNMLVVEMKNAVVRRVDMKSNIIFTVAGTGTPGFSGDGGSALMAQFNQPHSLVCDANDNIYICDIMNQRVRRVDAATGIVTTLIGGGEQPLDDNEVPFESRHAIGPRAMDFVGENVFVLALREGNSIYRGTLDPQSLTKIAGNGKKGLSVGSLPGNEVPLSGPKGVAVAPNGDIYFADTESHTVRVIRVDGGHVETVVGDGERGDGPDGDPLQCRLARPHGVYVDAQGVLYIGDSENHRVRCFQTDSVRTSP